MRTIHLEGTTLEGGGQLLRLATTLSSLTSTPIHITSIRGKRSGGGGLKSQHLTSVQWLGSACNARISGAGLKSKEIMFKPSKERRRDWTKGGEVLIKQNTPGSVNLIFQAVLPFMLFAVGKGREVDRIKVKIIGGTNVSNSPSCEYVEQCLLPMLQRIGIPRIDTEVHSRGWSQGNARLGSVTYTFTPLQNKLPAFHLVERGDIESVKATILAPTDSEHLFRDELDVYFDRYASKIFGSSSAGVEVTFEDSQHEKRYYLLLVATTTTGIKLGSDWLFDQGVRAGKADAVVSHLVKKVMGDLIKEVEHGGCVDEYMRDQLVVFQAMAEGYSKIYGGKSQGKLKLPSLHARTAYWVAKEIIDVDFDEGGGCEGIGFDPCEDVQRKSEASGIIEGIQNLHVADRVAS